MRLTKSNFDRAKAYLMHKGRPLEQCLFQWQFENGPQSTVLDALTRHQAANGGFFGMGEGPNESPSPMGSTVAFQYLTDVGAKSDCKVVEQGIQYFIDTYDHAYDAWPQTVPDDGFLEETMHSEWGNPGAEIVGYLWRYKELVEQDFLEYVTNVAMSKLQDPQGHVSTFADMCYLRCSQFIDNSNSDEIIQKLIHTVTNCNLERDHSKWDAGYFVKPYWYAMTPDSPLYPAIREEIDACLDFDIRTQTEDGSAFLTFSVDGIDQEIW
jgi:hypothetical protein